jgi:DNA invertase Pin-like site-specific DNA recombinase
LIAFATVFLAVGVSGLVVATVRTRRGRHEPGARVAGDLRDPGPLDAWVLPSKRRSRVDRVVGYVDAARSPASGDLRWQGERIAWACAQRGVSLLEIVHEREPRRGHALARPGLGYALERISAGEADGLVVAELSRLTYSVPELGRVLEWFSSWDARLIAAAPGLDTDEQGGRIAVCTIIELSRSERERLVERTRKGMRAARRKGPAGVADNPELRDRIARMRAEGMTLQAIADRLNLDGVPTVRGGAKWRPSSVQGAAGYRRPSAPRTYRLPVSRPHGGGADVAVEDLGLASNRPGMRAVGAPGPTNARGPTRNAPRPVQRQLPAGYVRSRPGAFGSRHVPYQPAEGVRDR